MKCPGCVETGQVSRFNEDIHPPTRGHVERFWDEGGNRHIHDGTIYTKVFTCTHLHSYRIDSRSPCPHRGCEWNEQALVKNGEKQPGEV